MIQYIMCKLLIQACCGPCSTIFNDGDFFFDGDNFDSEDEYQKRLEAMLVVAPDTIVMPYNPKTFDSCEGCIRYRLERCANYAKANGYQCFTTTLTVSPHKDSDMVNRIGREIGGQSGIAFVEYDLKKDGGFQKTVARSKELGLYRQKYCGCARTKV